MSLHDSNPERPQRLHQLRSWLEHDRALVRADLPSDHRLVRAHAAFELALAEYRSAWSHVFAEAHPDKANPYILVAPEGRPPRPGHDAPT